MNQTETGGLYAMARHTIGLVEPLKEPMETRIAYMQSKTSPHVSLRFDFVSSNWCRTGRGQASL